MIESYLQITCDNCGEVDPSDIPNITMAEFRKSLHKYGWVKIGGKDYCQNCRPPNKAINADLTTSAIDEDTAPAK